MPERIANKIILAEDPEQQNLVRRYLERCGHSTPFRLVPLPAISSRGSGEKYVRDQYSMQVRACRSALGKRASALLVVVVDADTETTKHRAEQLSSALKEAGEEGRTDGEPIVVLIPRRNVETWIRALLGDEVDEVTDYKKSKPTYAEISSAAAILYQWTRPNSGPGPTCPISLTECLAEWKKIPS